MPAWCLPWLLALTLVFAPCMAAELRYPRAPVGDDFRPLYPAALLRLALAKAGQPMRLVPSLHHMEQERALLSLEREEAVDVVWSMTSIERERRLLPVRIPLDKGLYGWRIALLRADRRELLREVRELADLRPLRAGQGHDWPDTEILRANGLQVETSASYGSLFQMLRSARFDYFPRAVLEARDETLRLRTDDLLIDDQIVLHYPTALYYFFSKRRPELAESVRLGLERALADGSFERLFEEHHGADLRKARLDRRRIIELDNPLLPPQTPLQRRELWYHP